MILRLIVALFAGLGALASAETPEPSAGQPRSEKTKADFERYEKFYREAFRESGIQKCVESAPKAAAAGFDISPTCACAADTLLASKSLDQLIEMETSKDLPAELAGITIACMKTNPPVQKSKDS